MLEVTDTLLCIAEVTGACLCYYCAFLLYEDEQGQIRNKLEDWWLRFFYRQEQALSRATVFMRGIAALTSRVLELLFGNRPVSFRLLGTSIYLSLASAGLVGTASILYAPELFGGNAAFTANTTNAAPPPIAVPVAETLVWFVLLIALALLCSRSRWMQTLTVVSLVLLSLSLVGWVAVNGLTEDNGILLLAVAAFIGSMISDVLFISATRMLLRWCEMLVGSIWCAAMLLGNVAIGVCLCFAPVALALTFPFKVLEFAPTTLLYLAEFNALDGLVSILLVSMAGLLLLHRIMWPAFTRILYFVAKTDERKKLLAALGSVLVFLAFGGTIWQVVQKVKEAVF